MFARGVLSLYSARFPAFSESPLTPIIPTDARPSHKSNHSRTYGIPGGGGCTGFLVRPIRLASKPFVSPTYPHFARNFFVSPTYAKTGGYTPCGKRRRADVFDYFPYFWRFLLKQKAGWASPSPTKEGSQAGAGATETGLKSGHYIHQSPITNH